MPSSKKPHSPQKAVWLELSLSVPAEYADAAANFLIEQGSTGILEEPPPAKGAAVTLKAYLKNNASGKRAVCRTRKYAASLQALAGGDRFSAAVAARNIPDEDWNKKWKSFFQPLRVTEHIVIKPSWKRYRRNPAETVIELDPGMAFGTGTHPSTRMCLRAIELLAPACAAGSCPTLLDVGTGSGILAIAAALLGFTTVVGIDTDYQAVCCARTNASKNNVSASVALSTRPLKKIPGSFGMVVANIMPHILLAMQQELTGHLAEHGYLVLSGILKEKLHEVCAAFAQHLACISVLEEEGWVCPVFQKTS